MDGWSLGAIARGLTVLLDVFFDESLLVDFVNDALSITEEERCHDEE